MTTTTLRNFNLGIWMRRMRINRGMAFGLILLTALIAFETFNYSTTVFALEDLLGDLKFLSIPWATILAVAFCCIDFAGIARLFTPEEGAEVTQEVWYLFGAWLLAATMNAMLTWWGVSIAILDHQSSGNLVIGRETLLRVVPVFVAVLVWLLRVLIIGTFSAAGGRLFSLADRKLISERGSGHIYAKPGQSVSSPNRNSDRAVASASFRSVPKPGSGNNDNGYSRTEPTYQSASMSGSRQSNSTAMHK
ncbi:MAG: hypothetical protein JW908_13720 [Anaerolineales bacterium]|nr:hypothetical protein [Anaerolineales bacterium]